MEFVLILHDRSFVAEVLLFRAEAVVTVYLVVNIRSEMRITIIKFTEKE
jgi:hypothetical protein